MTRTPHGLLLGIIMFVGVVMLAIVTFFVAGPVLETKFYPVLTDIHVQEVPALEPGTSRFQITATKVRSCEYVQTVALVWYKDHWEPAEVVTSTQKKYTRPLGKQNFGIWTVLPGDGQPIRVEVHHICHPFWTTVNNMGVWK